MFAIEETKKEAGIIKEKLYRLKDVLYGHSNAAGSPNLLDEVENILKLVQKLENDSYEAKFEY
jgi:hypothetical protein